MEPGEEGNLLDFLSEESPPRRQGAPARRVVVAGLAVLAVILTAAVAVPALLITERRADLESELGRRLSIQAEARSEVLRTWLEGNASLAARVSESELFRLFVTELAMEGGAPAEAAPGAAELPEPLALQLPYMEQLLTQFVRETDFLSAHLVSPKGQAFLAAVGSPSLSPAQSRAAVALFDRGAVYYGPARPAAGGLVADVYAPVFPAQVDSGQGRPAAVLVVGMPVARRFAELTAPPALGEPGERLRLLQEGEAGLVEIRPGADPALRPVPRAGLIAEDGTIPYARRGAVAAGEEVYSAGAAVPDTAWWVVQEIDAAAATAELTGFERWVVAVAVLLVLIVVLALAAVWWRTAEAHSRAAAEQLRRLAARIETQRRLLDSINRTIADHLGLKDLDGSYRYVNAAFARALGRPAEEIVGRDDTALFGPEAAARLRASDAEALERGGPVTGHVEVSVDGRPRHLQVSKVPLADAEGRTTGIVSVARDVTELVEEQRKKDRAVAQMVATLVRAVELRDPYLAGHSRRVAAFAVETARRLGASAEEVAAVEIAANLSQIGKLGVPRRLLTKAARLEPNEIAQMRAHVRHAERLLADVDFELPVLETLRQMHERLDGGGYPDGLAGDQILRTARVLGACDVFCARVEPRSYRDGITPAAALEVLEANPARYDAEVVAALRAVVESDLGERLLAGIARGAA